MCRQRQAEKSMRRGPSMGLTGRYSRLSRPDAQPVTSTSQLLSPEMPRVCSGGLRVDSGKSLRRKGGCAGPGGKVDAPELSSGPGWEIQEVSRVGAQGVTSKSKLLAREMPRVRRRGLRVDSGESLRRKVAVRGQAAKPMRRGSHRALYAR